MLSRKISFAIKAVIVVLGIVLALGIGLLFGYKYILNQDVRYKNYNAQIMAASESIAAGPTPTPYPTDDNGSPILPTNENGDIIPTTTRKPTTPTVSVRTGENVVIDENTPGSIMIYISLGDSTSTIAKKLKDLGVIDNVTVFTIFSKFNGFDGSYKYGTHFVKKNMSYDQVMFILSQQPATRTIRFLEGVSYRDIKLTLKENQINFDETKLDALMLNAQSLTDYDFVQEIPSLSQIYDSTISGKRDFALEGYLFPDTYRFDMNSDEETIIRTFLNNTDDKLIDEYYTRAEEMGMSMDQIITLASIIQKESGLFDDMRKVSRVFHNRLADDFLLQSDATINYIRNREGLESEYVILQTDMDKVDPYNTYLNTGLPPGPICSPGTNAIRAALYPSTENYDYYYFVARGDGSGENAFATTLAEHEANLEKYFYPIVNAPAPTGD